MKKFIILLGVISLSLVAMDDDQIKENIKQAFIQRSVNPDNLLIIVSNNDVPAPLLEQKQKIKRLIEKHINLMRTIYKGYFDTIKEKDKKHSIEQSFKLRVPSFYLKPFQAQWFNIFSNSPLKNKRIFFTQKDYQKMDQKFLSSYQRHNKDLVQTWDEFINYFLDNIIESYRQIKNYFE